MIGKSEQASRSAGHFCLLLGAGASARAGIPLMRKMGEDFRAVIQKNSPELVSVLNSVPDDPQYATWRESNNIEALLFFLYAAADLARGSDGLLLERDAFFNGAVADESLQHRQTHARLSAILALKACSFILDKTSHHNNDLSYLDGLWLLLQRDESLDVFSLNYDTVIEDFCAACQVQCVDGFDSDGDWQPSVFFERPVKSLSLRLWKLHGSVTWIKDRVSGNPKKAPLPGTWERRILTGHSSSPTTETNLIYPGLGKTAVGPMRLLFEAFHQRLLQSDCCFLVSIGYSFADTDVRNLILDALARNENLQLLVVCGKSSSEHVRELSDYAPDLNERIRAIDEQFESALDNRSIQRAISELSGPRGTARQQFLEPPKPAPKSNCDSVTQPVDLKSFAPRIRNNLPKPRLICAGAFKCVRRLCSGNGASLLLTDTEPHQTSRLLKFNLRTARMEVVASWVGEGSKFAINDNVCTVVETKLHDFQFGIGSCWQIDLTTGYRYPLLPNTVGDRKTLEEVVRAAHRPTSDAEQSSHLETFGVLSWPTAIEVIPRADMFLLIRSKTIISVASQESSTQWRRFPNCSFLNLTIVAHLIDSRFLLLETVRGAQGVLWEIDVSDPSSSPKFLIGGLREPSGLVVLPDRHRILFTENLPHCSGRLWLANLNDNCRAELIREDLDQPGEMALLTDTSVAMITREALREVAFA